MKKLETIENEVKKILDKDIRARKDDMYLYYTYCTKYGVLNEKAFVQLFYNKNFRKEYNVDARINKEGDYIRYAINDSRSSNFKRLIDQE